MKTKDFKKNIVSKSEKELNSILIEKSLALRAFRFSVAGSNMRNVKEGKTLKKDMARIKTFLNKK